MRLVKLSLRRAWLLLISLLTWGWVPVAWAHSHDDVLSSELRLHGAVMLLIAPEDGRILDASEAAERFYGRSLAQLRQLFITDLNALDDVAVAEERARALSQQRNYFIFPHHVAGGEVRAVEVFSSPVTLPSGRIALLSVIHDLSGRSELEATIFEYKEQLEALVDQRTRELGRSEANFRYFFWAALVLQTIAIVALLMLARRRRQALRALKREMAERALADAEVRKLSVAVEQSPVSIVITDLDAVIVYANAYAAQTTGYSREELIGQNPRILKSGKASPETYFNMWATLLRGEIWRGDLTNRRKDGSEYLEAATIAPVRGANGEITHYLAIKEDITERRRNEARIHHLAFYDELTGLPNRAYLFDKITNSLNSRRRLDRALLLLDVDRFKLVNDARGQAQGDALLVALTQRMQSLLHEEDLLVRLAADEFAVLLQPGATNVVRQRAESIAEGVHRALKQPFLIDGEAFDMTVSMGAALFSDASEALPQAVFRCADTALHKAKDAGGNQTVFYASSLSESAEQTFRVERELRRAISDNDLRLYLQSQVDTDGRVVAAEALVRWQHPDRGVVMPGQFIMIAEESDLIVDIGKWVLSEVCRLMAAERSHEPPLRISVNLSPRHFRQQDFVPWITELIRQTGINPSHLTLEVTESLMIDDINDVVAKMTALVQLGVHFSVDDFGTGYSSLAYLKRLPVDELKIDRSFVQDALNNSGDAALISSIIAVAHNMNLRVVAEGVETTEQAQFLNTCAKMIHQGYLYGRPEPAEDWLAKWRETAQELDNAPN